MKNKAADDMRRSIGLNGIETAQLPIEARIAMPSSKGVEETGKEALGMIRRLGIAAKHG